MRLIDADALKNHYAWWGDTEQRRTFDAIVDAQPTVGPEWSPFPERLPESNGRYLVTCAKCGAWSVDWNIWKMDPKPSWLWEQGVTAWMPLPEPYKEGEK